MNTITWEVKFLSPPRTLRHCKKCGAKTEHASSGAFRVNAQKKCLDVWLVYRCAHCRTTWNLTILSRVSPGGVGRELLDKFTANDAELARRYAMDAELLNRNGAETEAPAYCVEGEAADFTAGTRLRIVCDAPCSLKAAKVVREKLSLPRSAFEDMAARGVIRMESGADIRRARLQTETFVIIEAAAQARL